MSSWRVASVAIVATLLWGMPTVAQESQFTTGGGVGAAPDYQGSDDYEAVPIFVFRWGRGEGRFLEAGPTPDIGGLGVRFNILGGDEPLVLGPIVNYRPRRSDVDEDQVDEQQLANRDDQRRTTDRQHAGVVGSEPHDQSDQTQDAPHDGDGPELRSTERQPAPHGRTEVGNSQIEIAGRLLVGLTRKPP